MGQEKPDLFQRFLRKSQRERDEKDDHILQSWETTNPSQVERNSENTHTEFLPTDSYINSKLINQGLTGTEGQLGHYLIDDGIILSLLEQLTPGFILRLNSGEKPEATKRTLRSGAAAA